MDDSATSYTINIYDKLNKTTLLEITLNNTTESSQNLGILTNLPMIPTQIEVSIKRTGGNGKSKVYLESLTLNYN